MKKQFKTFLITIQLIVAISFVNLVIIPKVQAQGIPTLVIEPSFYQAEKLNEVFNITVEIHDVETADKMVAVQFRVPYNDTMLDALDVVEGPFMQQFNNTSTPPYTFLSYFIEDDPVYGPNVLVGLLLLPNGTGYWSNFPDGNGILATITFKAIYRPIEPATATCLLNLEDTMIIDVDDNEIDHTTSGATYEALPLPIPSLTVDPPTYQATLIGEVFETNVNISDIDSDWRLVGLQFRMLYDADVLDVLDVVEGPFMQQFNNTSTPPYTFFISFIEDDPIYGPNVLVGILLTPNGTGYWSNFPDGNGILATITFKAISQTADPEPPASSSLPLVNTLLVSDETDIPHTSTGGSYEIEPLTFSYEPSMPRAGQPMTFKAPEASYNVTYYWDFGDGTSLDVIESAVTHIYAAPGEYNVTLYCMTDGLESSMASKIITVWSTNMPTIDVTVDVGSIHFKGEIAEFSILIANYGEAANATKIEALLYYNSALYDDLTSLVQAVDTGFYTITYNILGDAETGKYTLIVKAEYYNAKGICQESFQISPTLTNWDQSIAQITEIRNGIATISNGITNLYLNLTAVNATIADLIISNGVILAQINTAVGPLSTKLDAINASISGLITTSKGEILAQINTAVGPLTTRLDAINATITQVRGNTVTISTTLGEVETKLDGIQSTATTTLYAASILSAIAVILAALILMSLRKK